MANVIVIIILLVVVGAAVHSLIKAKKRGVRCIGCSDSGSCGSTGDSSGVWCQCGCHTKTE